MNETVYIWMKQKNGIGHVAKITHSVENNQQNENLINENYTGYGGGSQGYIEEVPEFGYDSWKLGARNGLEFAFSLIETFWIVNIQKIEGLSTSTNPTIIGYTIIRAFLEKIDFNLKDSQIEQLEELVFSSWTKPYKEFIPNFFNLTLTEIDE